MKDSNNFLPLITEGKGSKKIQNRGKSFGYQILGFGSGGGAADVEFDYLVVAGGASSCGGLSGGGGAGGYRTSFPGGTKIVLVDGAVITVGDGGIASPAYPVTGANRIASKGSDSSVAGSAVTVTSAGGGVMNTADAYPGSPSTAPDNVGIRDGGSGGGLSHQATLFGAGNVPPVSPPQGNPGGPGTSYAASGGGGSGGAGVSGSGMDPSASAGPGGPGTTNLIAPAYPGGTIFAGGGGGGGFGAAGSNPAPGGGGRGGDGCCSPGGPYSGVAGTNGLGGGAGGQGASPTNPLTYAGGSGVVILRIATADAPAGLGVAPGSNTIATDGTDKVLTYTVDGTVTF